MPKAPKQTQERCITKLGLYMEGEVRVLDFCAVNNLRFPRMQQVENEDWHFSCCAYYRDNSIFLNLSKCAQPAGVAICSNWNWPGNSIDREPFGVLAHELGHHVDVIVSTKRGLAVGSYSGGYGSELRRLTKEPPLTAYAPNDGEWFAEMFRLYVTNHALLALLRPLTHERLSGVWKPVSNDDWRKELGSNVPPRIIKSIQNKVG